MTGMATRRYQVYGLQVDSTRSLRALVPGNPDAPSDLRIDWSHTIEPESDWTSVAIDSIPAHVSVWHAGDGSRFAVRLPIDGRRCEFVLDAAATSLRVAFAEDLPIGRVKPYLFGSILSSVLRLRGTLSLHASAVSVDDRAVILVGRKGAGKSTTALAMTRQCGATILGDDVAAIGETADGFVVHPGPMHMQLSSEFLATSGSSTATVHESAAGTKVRVPLGVSDRPHRDYCTAPRPLAAIVFIEPGAPVAEDTFVAMPPLDALMALSRNVYGLCLADHVVPREFLALSRLARSVPAYCLRRGDELSRLPALCDAVASTVSGAAADTVARHACVTHAN